MRKKPKMSLKKEKNELFSKTYANLGLEHTEKTLVLEGYLDVEMGEARCRALTQVTIC